MLDPEKIAEERFPDVRSNSSSETFEPVYPSEIQSIKRDAFASGIRHAITLLYAEVKPEDVKDRKWYWVKLGGKDRVVRFVSFSDEFSFGNTLYAMDDVTSIRGPILPPSELLQAAEVE